MNELVYQSFKNLPEFKTIDLVEKTLYPLKKIKRKLTR